MNRILSLAMELGGGRGGLSIAEKSLSWGPMRKKGFLHAFPVDTSEDPCSLDLLAHQCQSKTASVGRGWTRS